MLSCPRAPLPLPSRTRGRRQPCLGESQKGYGPVRGWTTAWGCPQRSQASPSFLPGHAWLFLPFLVLNKVLKPQEILPHLYPQSGDEVGVLTGSLDLTGGQRVLS